MESPKEPVIVYGCGQYVHLCHPKWQSFKTTDAICLFARLPGFSLEDEQQLIQQKCLGVVINGHGHSKFSYAEMNNQRVTYAELNLHGNSKSQQRKSKELKSSATVTEQEITYTELNLQKVSQDPHGNDKRYHCKDLPQPLEKLIAGILALLCLALMVSLITVIFCVKSGEPHNPSPSNWTWKVYHFKCCPEEWLIHSNSCYYISSEKKTWNESLKDCTSKNSTLLYIDNKEEMNIFVAINILSWSGLSQRTNDGLWVWPDGSTLSSEWFTGPTENYGNCSYVDFFNKRFKTELCSKPQNYVCRRQPYN